ncbi:unnamed protein product [Adineta steineri]|uniref:PDZ domain-containing protein n=1 Tax=Adineta steineri TaxID=433720 RepID=A0A814ISL0_9BILA|nr:unnamed protein product [Adineta steineri]CAF1063659.1 unnamed protein product [Adineta steineri]
MATSTHSNPVYYSLSSIPPTGQKSTTRTVVLERGPEHNGFGLYLAEDVPTGLYVVTVERNSPAANANIQPGDRVLAVNGQLVSSMTENPKDMVVKAAVNSQSFTLTVQSTDIFKTIDMPLASSFLENNNNNTIKHLYENNLNKPQRPEKRTINATLDLESYLKSLFANENIQISPSATNNNEFLLTSNRHSASSKDSHSLPSRHLNTDNYKQESHRPHHHHHHRRRRQHHPKQPVLVTKETQTSANEDEDEDDNIQQSSHSSGFRQYPSHPTMGTSQRILRTHASNGSPESKPSSSKKIPQLAAKLSSPSSDDTIHDALQKSPSKSQHMADIVGAAIAAERNRGKPTSHDANIHEQTSSPEPTPVSEPNAVFSQEQNPPPPYTETADPEIPINDQGNDDGESYNVRNAQEDREPEPPAEPTFVATPADRGEGLHEIHLHRSPDFQGFGFHLQFNKLYYLVHRVEEGSPADVGGLRGNDVILKINDQTTDKMTHAVFVQIVNASTEVVFIVQHIDAYIRSNPVPPRNPEVASAVSTAITEENEKRKSGGLSKALNKLASR